METFMAKPADVERKWFVVDAAGIPMGRMASQVAAILRGKHKPIFTPHVDTGDHVIIINAGKSVLTGNKAEQKLYRTHSGYPGGLKEKKYAHLMETKPEFIVYEAVRRMLPKNSLGREMIKKLRVYRGSEHGHSAQKPELLQL